MLIDADEFRTILYLELRETGKENVLQAIKKLEKREDVLLANPDYFVEFFANPIPTPTYYNSQWPVQKISLPNAWDLSIGKNTVVVGVMDSGIQGTHPDLQGRLATNLCADFTTGTTLTPNPTDSAAGIKHGTLVAGVIGAQRDSGVPGITGVAQNIRLASLKINDPDTAANGTQLTNAISSIHRAIDFATNNQIRIINCSTGYRASDSWATSTHRSTLQTAIQGYPGLFVTAAGNEGWNNDINYIYPANFDLPRLITVGASTSSDSRLNGSCYGKISVNLFAPGENIYSTNKNGGYSFASGTSLAAPYVAGVAALMLSIDSTLSAETIKTVILNNVDKEADGVSTSITNYCVSGGRLNAFKAVSAIAFTTSNTSGGISIDGLMNGFTLPSNSSLVLPDRFAPQGSNMQQNVVAIGNNAFANRTQLAQILIPASVTSIGSNAFEDCTSLEKVVIQRDIGNISSLESNAFLGCSSLETIEVPTKRILDYLYATNWSNYSSYMHYIGPITDGLTIDSVGGKSQYYLFQIVETRYHNFYHHCDNPIEITIYDDENSVILTNSTWEGDPVFIELEDDELYKIVIETTDDEYFSIHIDEINETELELGIKYYETLNSYSYAYYTFTTPPAISTISYTINSTIVSARTNMWLYNGYDNLITYDFGDFDHNGAKIDYYLTPNTTYTVLLYLTSYYFYDDYTIQFYETEEEVYHLDWGGLSKQYFDPLTYDYVNFIVFSYCYDLEFDEVNKTITFGMIECFWDVTFEEYPNCPEEYVIGMMIGITYDSFENTLAFFSMNGFYEYQAALPYTYSYSATVTDVSITFSSAEWASFVTQGPRV